MIRISASAGDDEEYGCPAAAAAKAHPAQEGRRSRKPRLERFPLGPVRTALDAIEFEGSSLADALALARSSGRPLHPGLGRFVETAVATYAAARCMVDLPGFPNTLLEPVRGLWVAQKSNGALWELYAWGRAYRSADRRVREIRLLTFSGHGDREHDPARTAIAAFAAAFGAPALWPELGRWGEPFEPYEAPAENVELVLVTEFGLADGSYDVLFHGTPDQATAAYADHGRGRVRQIANSGPAKPGGACASCKLLTACDTIDRVSGLLGVAAKGSPLRQVSVSDLRCHRKCPAQAHLRALHLPRDYEYSARAERGHAIHAHLAVNHANPVHVACKAADMTVDPAGWSAGRWRLDGIQAEIGARMLAHHLDVCPLDNPLPIDHITPERSVAFHDTAANAIVIATPDLIYEEGGSVIWRETKTTETDRWPHADPLEQFPQLALGVVILAEGLLGGDPRGSRVELETLRPYAGEVDLIDPTDPERVATARRVLREFAAPWHADLDHLANPGAECRRCPVARWCPDRAGAIGDENAEADGEESDDADDSTVRPWLL